MDLRVELGEELRVVADQRNAPPAACRPQALRMISWKGQQWQMWRVTLPASAYGDFSRWLQALGVEAIEPAWEVRFASVSEEMAADGRSAVFSANQPLVARIRAPHSGARAEVSLRTGSTRTSETFLTPNARDEAFISFSVAWPGSNELSVAHADSVVPFETKQSESLFTLREVLRAVPRLEVRFGEVVITAWEEPVDIFFPLPNEELPVITIKPDVQDLRIAMSWDGLVSRPVEEGLTAEIAVRRLKMLWETRRSAEVRIDCGGLGTVRFNFRPVQKRQGFSSSEARRMLWLGTAAQQNAVEGTSAAPWIMRRASTASAHLLRAVSEGKNSRWNPLLVRALKETGH